MSTLVFSVVDNTCEVADQTYFPPKVVLTTRGTTTVRTRRGYAEYVPSTGALYKTITWTGESVQLQMVLLSILQGGDVPGGGAKLVYSGASSIDIYGHWTSHHRKDMYVPCNNQPWPSSNITYSPFMRLYGYCYTGDPASCASCDQNRNNWMFSANWATHSQYDTDYGIFVLEQAGYAPHATITPTTLTYNDLGFYPAGFGNGFPVVISGVGTPLYTLNGISAHWFGMNTKRNYSATLSDEFTVADEIASQVVLHTNSPIAENRPSSLTWIEDNIHNIQSRMTSVDYTLTCSNLIIGKSYSVTVEIRNVATYAALIRNYAITASSTTETVTDTLAVPAVAGQMFQVRNPQIAFVP